MLLVGPIQRSKGRDKTKRDPPGPPGWKFGIVITMPHKKKLIVTVTRSIDNDRDNTNWNREQVLVREHDSLMHLLGRQDIIEMIHELHSYLKSEQYQGNERWPHLATKFEQQRASTFPVCQVYFFYLQSCVGNLSS